MLKNSRRTLLALPVVAALTLSLAACGSDSDDSASAAGDSGASGASGSDGDTASGDIETIRIGASPNPHAKILEFVNDELAADAGIELEIETYDDYVLPNRALFEGDLDANFFQHLPYFEAQVEEHGFEFDHFPGIHIEPYALYSTQHDAVADIPDGAQIGVTNDPANQARTLKLLAQDGLITLDEAAGDEASIFDVTDNPHDFDFVELAPEQLVHSLDDVDAAVINGNFALEADLNPTVDGLLLEDGKDNPYANLVAFRSEDADSQALQTLDELLRSEETRTFIEENWDSGEIIPAF